MFERFSNSPVGWSATASLIAMLALNVFALSQQVQAASQMANVITLSSGYLA